ncbi:MAG: transglycosylase domain-containing protein [Actinomycetota bacterium]|nr:transglycosylase domain-containing protein [Actinomycetota bacterium]
MAWPLRPVLLLLIMAAAGVFVALTFLPIVGALGTAAKNVEQKLALPANTDIQFPRFPQRSTIFAEDNTRLATLYLENRKVVHLDQIAPVGRRAVLAIEDYQFFHHGAIDVKAIVRAALANLRAGHITQGGSTITQQLVKNITGHTADTLIRKLREAQLAVKIEQTYTKKEILELYLNEIYLGNGVYGLEAASEFYFGHHANLLTLPEAAMLAGMISNPSQYDPLADPTATLDRRNVVLARMAQIGWISQDKATTMEALPLGLSKNAGKPLQSRQPFFVQFVRKLIEENKDGQFDVLGATKNQRVHALYQGGLSIYTTLNPAWESTALHVIKSHLPLNSDPQSSIATVEPGTGAIRVLASGRNFSQTQTDLVSGLDGLGRRQTGSAFKPFTLVAAFRQGIPPTREYSSASPVDLSKECNGWKPFNAEGAGDSGFVDLYTATADSINVVFGQLARDVGPPNIARAAEDMGIPGDTLPQGGADCSITLGTGSVSPLDMATAYATLADDGMYCPYYAVERIVGPGGKTIYQHDPTSQCHQVVKKDIALLVTDMLKGVVAHGTGTRANIGRPQAGKTGTNEEFKDAWFCGYVPQLATAIWVGYPGVPRSMLGVEGFPEMFGGDIPAEEWHDVMSVFVRGMPPKDWPPPPPPPTGTVPDVVGKAQDEAIKILGDANFSPMVAGQVNSTLPAGTVASQSPGGGSTVELGSIVNLYISNGQPPKAQVPGVVGLPEAAARSALAGAGFNVAVNEVLVADPAQDGLVLQQQPGPGASVLAGSTVTITVGRFTQPSPPPPPPSPPPTTPPGPTGPTGPTGPGARR